MVKAAPLDCVTRDLGKERIGHLDRNKPIDYAKMRADQGAGLVTLSLRLGVIKIIITHAAAVHGLCVECGSLVLVYMFLQQAHGPEPRHDNCRTKQLCLVASDRFFDEVARLLIGGTFGIGLPGISPNRLFLPCTP